MNPTIVKEVWHGSWEVRLLALATLITGVTNNDITPYIAWLPDYIEVWVAQFWQAAVFAAAMYLRLKKTSTKLVATSAEADPPEVVAAAKASLKPITATAAAAAAATLEAYQKQNPVPSDPKA